MKNIRILWVALLVIPLFTNCSKDDEKNDPTPSIVCKIVTEMIDRGDDGSRYSTFVYDDVTGLLTQINEAQTSTSDVHANKIFSYNATNQLVKIETFWNESSVADETTTITYTSGKVTKIVELSKQWDEQTSQNIQTTSTINISYNGNTLSKIAVSGDRDNMGFKDFVYVNGNLSTLKVDFKGDDTKWVGVEAKDYDDKNNLNKRLPIEWGNILFGSSNNNMKVLVFTEAFTDGDMSAKVGDTLFYQTYTYDMKGNVLVLTSHPTIMDSRESTQTYTWECSEE